MPEIAAIKYLLLSSLIGGFVWLLLVELDERVGLNLFWLAFGRLGAAIPVIIGAILGTYLGLWMIGRMRKPSVVYGVLVGLMSTVFIFFLDLAIAWFFYREYWYSLDYLIRNISEQFIAVWLVAALIGGISGVLVVRRLSPSFCPNCGKPLQSGRGTCPSCGANVQ